MFILAGDKWHAGMPVYFAGVNVSYGASLCFLSAHHCTDYLHVDLSRTYLSTDPLRYYRSRTRTENESDSEFRVDLLYEREKKKKREREREWNARMIKDDYSMVFIFSILLYIIQFFIF